MFDLTITSGYAMQSGYHGSFVNVMMYNHKLGTSSMVPKSLDNIRFLFEKYW